MTRIEHNASLRAPVKPAQGDFSAKPMKTPAYPAKIPQKGADEFWRDEWLCSAVHVVQFDGKQPVKEEFLKVFSFGPSGCLP